MERPFKQDEIEFLQKVGGTRAGDKWVVILRKLCDYLSDVRSAPAPANGDMAQFGSMVLARRMAGKVIEDELIDVIRSGDQDLGGGEKTSYR